LNPALPTPAYHAQPGIIPEHVHASKGTFSMLFSRQYWTGHDLLLGVLVFRRRTYFGIAHLAIMQAWADQH